MDQFFYFGILAFLFLLATFDLSIGVANDAVNFMSPAVGAKVAKFKTALIVAAVGIFVGATTSSGMMDIARHGIMQPQHYYLTEVMCVFLAVSATDVILMDIFNTLGLPTSTTVSMVFGLFGATTALALTKIIGDGMSYGELINTDKALTVIISIFLSVAIAFVIGLIVMWISRVVFTFNYKKNMKWGIAVFGGASITSIFYFLLVSGLKNSTLLISINPEWTPAYMDQNKLVILAVCFVVFTVLVEILHLLKVNIFKLIVLFGTFALAMAFAGNDLVNFIGVPLAGLESVLMWADAGYPDAATFEMDALAGPSTQAFFVGAKPWFLVAAGVIMTIAIMTSKKARKVIENTNNLSRQDDGEEVFSSSKLARKMVRNVLNTTSFIGKHVPQNVTKWVNSRFNTDEAILDEGMAFDLVRASVNLVLAGLLIVIGTSLQLPLSTTYVAFMVAMGTSLADRAWGRETAVYRITGVITVVGGWFITAGAAFILSMTIASLNYFGGIIAMVCVVAAIAFVLINNNRKFKQKQQESENVDTLFRQLVRCQDKQQCWGMLRQHVTNTQNEIITSVLGIFSQTISGLVNEDVRRLRETQSQLEETRALWKRYKRKEILGMRKISQLQAVEKNTWFHLGCNNISQMLYGLKRMMELIVEHVDNNFNPLEEAYVNQLQPLCTDVENYLRRVQGMIVSGDFSRFDEGIIEGSTLKSRISDMRHELQHEIQRQDANIRVALLYLNTLQEIQELVSTLRHLLRASKRFQE